MTSEHRPSLPEIMPAIAPVGLPPENPTDLRHHQIREMLEQGLEQVESDAGFMRYLRMLSLLHEYSPHNVLLIATQKPDATMVNSYDRWQKLGRQVRRGERGLKIYYPVFHVSEETDRDSGETVKKQWLSGFGVGNVFDISQTEGEELPKPPTIYEELGEIAASVYINYRVSAFLINEGLTVESLPRYPGSTMRGFYQPEQGRVAVLADDPEYPFSIGKTKTLLHEAGHYLADHRGNVDRIDAEFVAEASAWATMQGQGIDTGESSFPYLKIWGADQKRIERNIIEVGRIERILTSVIANHEPTPEHMTDPWEEAGEG